MKKSIIMIGLCLTLISSLAEACAVSNQHSFFQNKRDEVFVAEVIIRKISGDHDKERIIEAEIKQQYFPEIKYKNVTFEYLGSHCFSFVSVGDEGLVFGRVMFQNEDRIIVEPNMRSYGVLHQRDMKVRQKEMVK